MFFHCRCNLKSGCYQKGVPSVTFVLAAMFVAKAKFYLKISDNHNTNHCGYDLCIVFVFLAVRRCFITIQHQILEVLSCANGEQLLSPYHHQWINYLSKTNADLNLL